MSIRYELNTKMIKHQDDKNYRFALPNSEKNFDEAIEEAFADVERVLLEKYGSDVVSNFCFFVDNAVSSKSRKKNKFPYPVSSCSGKTPYLVKLWTIDAITYFLLKLNIENGSDKHRIKMQLSEVLTTFDFSDSSSCTSFIEINPELKKSGGFSKTWGKFEEGINKVKGLYMDRWATEYQGKYLFIDNAAKKGKYTDLGDSKRVKEIASCSGWTPTCYPVSDSKYHIIRLGITAGGESGEIVQQFTHEFTHWTFFALNGKAFPACPHLNMCSNSVVKKCKKVPSESNFCEEAICNAAALILLNKFSTPDDVKFFKDLYGKSPELYYRRGEEIATLVDNNFEKLGDLIVEMVNHHKRKH